MNLGTLSYVISAETGRLKSNLNEAKTSMNQADRTMTSTSRNVGKQTTVMNQGITKLTSALKALGVAFMGAFAARAVINAIRTTVKELGTMADRLLDLQDITGITTTKLQEYEHIARIAGVSSEAVANAAQNLTNRFQNLYRESSPISRAFRDLSIDAYDVSGAIRNTGDIMDEVIVKMAAMENQTERNALGAQVFGGSWKDMAPILAMGAEGLEKVRQEAHELGLVMDREALEKANKFRQETERLQASMEALKREIGMELIPVLTDLSTAAIDSFRAFQDMRAELDFIQNNLTGLSGAWATLNAIFGRTTKATEKAIVQNWGMIKTVDKLIEKAIEEGRVEQDNVQEMIKARNEGAKMLQQEARYVEHLIETKTELAEQNAAELEAEKERRVLLGQLGRLQEDIANAEREFISANSTAARVAHLQKIEDLKAQEHQILAVAQAMAIPPVDLQMGDWYIPFDQITGQVEELMAWFSQDLGVGLFDGVNQDIDVFQQTFTELMSELDLLGAKAEVFGEDFDLVGHSIASVEDAMMQLIENGFRMGAEEIEVFRQMLGGLREDVDEAKDSMIDWGQIASGAAATIGMAMMDMAGDTKKSVGDIIKSLLRQVTAQLISQITTSIPFPASIPLAAGAGLIAGGLFSKIPGMADGGIVPPGFPNDTYMARLTSGEAVIPPKALPQMGGGELTTRVAGQDLLIILNEAQRRNTGNY